MARTPKPWLRASTNSWYVEIGGTQFSLGKNKRKAHEKYVTLLAQHNLGELGTKATLHTIIGQYETWLVASRAPTTVKQRLYKLTSLRSHFDKRVKAEDVKPFQIEEWARSTGDCKELSPTTVYDRIHLVKHIYARAKKMGAITKNPVADMEAPTPKMRRCFVPPERFGELFAAISDNEEATAFITFMLETGARATEMYNMRVEYLDEAGRRIVFPIEKSKGNHRAGARQRVIHLNDKAFAIAHARKQQFGTGAMFRRDRGQPIEATWAVDLFRTLKKALGMPDLCATALRHSYAYGRLTAGQEPVVVAKLMGHSSTNMLFTRYGHLESGNFLSEKAGEIELTP